MLSSNCPKKQHFPNSWCIRSRGRIDRKETDSLGTLTGNSEQVWKTFGQIFCINYEWKRTETNKESSFAQQCPSQHKHKWEPSTLHVPGREGGNGHWRGGGTKHPPRARKRRGQCTLGKLRAESIITRSHISRHKARSLNPTEHTANTDLLESNETQHWIKVWLKGLSLISIQYFLRQQVFL